MITLVSFSQHFPKLSCNTKSFFPQGNSLFPAEESKSLDCILYSKMKITITERLNVCTAPHMWLFKLLVNNKVNTQIIQELCFTNFSKIAYCVRVLFEKVLNFCIENLAFL